MDFHKLLENVKLETEKELVHFFQEKKIGVNNIDPHTVPVTEHIASFTLRGGKRLRAFLCWLGYGSVRQTIQNSKFKIQNVELLSAMLSLELFQSFALIHDDIIDKDTTRRGGPTMHEQLGINMAILAGDLALVWADELMNKTNSRIAWDLYQHMKEEVILGQSLDVLSQFGEVKIDKGKIDELKTAWYSVVRPLQIGAALAGADKNHLKNLAGFGVPVGKLFQLKDDQMDGDVSEAVFHRESVRLEKQSKEALAQLSLSEDWHVMFEDLIIFVLTRTA